MYNFCCLFPSSGPATVRMVSSNGPPVPMPMQVPPGHMVQQIVDEHGILTHVILSPQPPGPTTPLPVGPYVRIPRCVLVNHHSMSYSTTLYSTLPCIHSRVPRQSSLLGDFFGTVHRRDAGVRALVSYAGVDGSVPPARRSSHASVEAVTRCPRGP